MSRKFTFVIATLALMAGAGCTSQELKQARSVQPQGSAFEQNLAEGYLKMSETEYKQGDRRDGATYANRATASGKGQMVLPDDFTNRKIPSSKRAELNQGRERLIAALDKDDRRQLNPDVAASSQIMFDCWVEQAEENWQREDIAACREGFMTAVAELEATPSPMAAVPAAPTTYQVFFDFAKSTLTPEGEAIVEAAVNSAKTLETPSVLVVGHTDTVGSAKFNQRLSEQRATAVADAMVAMGIPANSITTEGRGETGLLVPTADGVKEPQNRRAEIFLKK